MMYRLVQMSLRCVTLFLMLVAMLYQWECYTLTTPAHFIMSGVYGAYIVITMALLVEVSIDQRSDVLIESTLLLGAICLNLVCSVLSFWDIQDSCGDKTVILNKAFLSVFCATMYLADLILCCLNKVWVLYWLRFCVWIVNRPHSSEVSTFYIS